MWTDQRLNSKKKELPSLGDGEVRLRKMMTETQGWRKERKEKEGSENTHH